MQPIKESIQSDPLLWEHSSLVLLHLPFWTCLNWRLCQPSDTIWESSSSSYIAGLEVRGLSASPAHFTSNLSSVEEHHVNHPFQIFYVDFCSSNRKLTVLFYTSLLLHMLLPVLGMPFSITASLTNDYILCLVLSILLKLLLIQI